MWDHIDEFFALFAFSFSLYLSSTVLLRAYKTGVIYFNGGQTKRQEEPGIFWIGISLSLLAGAISLAIVAVELYSVLTNRS